MKTINHEYFVSLEVAKLLEKAGFDWNCYKLYEREYERDGIIQAVTSANWNSSLKYYSAPTLEVAQRWLREVKNFDVLILFQWLGDRSITYKYELRLFGRPYALQEVIFDSYEEAQETGIKKALEMILEKEE